VEWDKGGIRAEGEEQDDIDFDDLERRAIARGSNDEGDEGGEYEERVGELHVASLLLEGEIGREENAVPLQVEADADSKAIHVSVSREAAGSHDRGLRGSWQTRDVMNIVEVIDGNLG
jgi:hypothetical protein